MRPYDTLFQSFTEWKQKLEMYEPDREERQSKGKDDMKPRGGAGLSIVDETLGLSLSSEIVGR